MNNLGLDTHNASRKAPKSDVWDELRQAREAESVEGRLEQAAQLRRDLDAVEITLDRLFGRAVQLREDCDAVGVKVEQRLSPMLSAAYGQWVRGQDVPKRIELTSLSEAPIGPEHAE